MDKSQPQAVEIITKTIITHTITYFIIGFAASTVFNYSALYAESSLNQLMHLVSNPIVMAGPLFQPIRGALFGIVFFMLRDILFGRRNGWLVMWIMLLVLGVINPFGPAPGSIEGMIYTKIPIGIQLKGLPEVILQSMLLSVILVYWVKRAPIRWLNWTMGIVFFFVMLLPTLGLLMGK